MKKTWATRARSLDNEQQPAAEGKLKLLFKEHGNQGRGRACIAGVWKGTSEALLLAAWLESRIDVVRFEQRAGTGAFYVDYDDGDALPGRFIRSLRDRIHSLNVPPPEPFDVIAVHRMKGRVRLKVTGIGERELATLAMHAAGLPGVKSTRHIPGGRTMLVIYDPEKVSERFIITGLLRSDPAEWARDWHEPAPTRWLAALSGTSTLIACLAGVAPFSWLAIAVMLNTVRPIARSVATLRQGEVSIDWLDVAATLAALATRRPITAAFVIWMVGIGDFLLDVSANNARSALSMLMRRKEQEAILVGPDGRLENIPIGELMAGDHFLVRTGHSVTTDGIVVSGVAEVDAKDLTGESRLLPKKPGDPVFASTVVVAGELVVEVDRSGRNTEAARIEQILNTVGSKPLTLQRQALDLGSKLVLPTFGVAGLAAALSGEATRGVCVLITDFGTGFRIAVPVTALTAMALAAREGVLVKGAQYLERLSKTDVVIFDKTGTLTSGVPEVVEVVPVRGMKESALIRWCASAEARHDHPVAKALKAYAQEHGIPIVEPEAGSEEYAVGLGVSARVEGHRVRVGRASWIESQDLKIRASFKKRLARFSKSSNSSLCVALDDEVAGVVCYSDGTRRESAAIVRRMQSEGRRKIVLLSGDSPEVVRNLAREVGIGEAVGGLLPHQKAEYIKRLQAAGHVVAMVGDGINDAPALAVADVGISIAGSTDVALEAADVVLLSGGLVRLEKAFRISDQAIASVRRNLGLIIVPNTIAIVLGARGLIGPPLAAIINNGATALAVLAGTSPLFRLPHRRPRAGEEAAVDAGELPVEYPESAHLLPPGTKGAVPE